MTTNRSPSKRKTVTTTPRPDCSADQSWRGVTPLAEWGAHKAGDVVKVSGEKGVITFRYATVSPQGMVSLTCWQEVKGRGQCQGYASWRAWRPERVRAVKPKRGAA